MLYLIHTKKLNIFDQLRLEEYLLKNTNDSFCIINEGTPSAVVLGTCNKENQLVYLSQIKKDNIPLIKRFTGGGTVFVDQNTIFITFIFSNNLVKIDLFPKPIIKWAENFYKNIFEINNFQAIENDFVINNKKIAGNAAYIKKDRFLLHTSFLLDFDIEKINKYLQLPKIAPAYRNNRSHREFLTPLKILFSKKSFIEKITKHLMVNFKIDKFDFLNTKWKPFLYKTKIL